MKLLMYYREKTRRGFGEVILSTINLLHHDVFHYLWTINFSVDVSMCPSCIASSIT